MPVNNITVEQIAPSIHYSIAARSDIGGREQQQDQAYLNINGDCVFAVVCDGMGGTLDGKLASKTAISTMSHAYTNYRLDKNSDVPAFLYQSMIAADRAVSTKMTRGIGGTTLVSTIISGSQMYWVSVGDSQLYIARSDEILQATRDHNYHLRLNEMLARGELTPDLYEQESMRGASLLSYLGKGSITLYDLTQSAFSLQQGDTILITTDGLSRALSNEDLRTIITSRVTASQKADSLIHQVRCKGAIKPQDNTTFIVIDVI